MCVGNRGALRNGGQRMRQEFQSDFMTGKSFLRSPREQPMMHGCEKQNVTLFISGGSQKTSQNRKDEQKYTNYLRN